MKKVICFVIFIFGALIVSSCSKDDGDVELKAWMMDDDGVETYEFNEGCLIVFNLRISNNTSEDYDVRYSLWGNNLFRVYSEDGKDMGLPFKGYVSPMGRTPKYEGERMEDICRTLKPGENFVIYCSWSGLNREDKYNASYPLGKTEDFTPTHLSPGNYYTSFKLGEREFKMKFVIK